MADGVAKIVIEADGSVARREFASVGDAASAVGVDIQSGIGQALDKTAASFASLDTKIASGELRGLPRTITQSTLAVQQLEAEIAQLRASGQDVAQLELAAAKFRDRLREATTQAGKMADTMEEVNRTVKASASAADFGMGKLGTSMGSALELMSKMYFVANVVGQSLQGIAKAMDSIQTATGSATEGSRQMNGELAAVGQSIASLDIVGLSENLGKFVASAMDGADATNALASATKNWNDALSGAVGKLSNAMRAQAAYTDGIAKQREALANLTKAMERQATLEMQNGELTDLTRKKVKELLDGYAALGDEVPEKLQKIVDANGILSSSQEAMVASLEGYLPALQEKDKLLLEGIALAEKDGVVTQQAKESIKAAINEQLEAYAKLGVAVPAALQEVADRYQAVVAVSKEALAELKKNVAELTEVVEAAQKKYDETGKKKEDRRGEKQELQELKDLELEGILTREQAERKYQLEAAASRAADEETRAAKKRALDEELEAYNELEDARRKLTEAQDKERTASLDAYYAEKLAAGQAASAAELASHNAEDIAVQMEKVNGTWELTNKAAKENTVTMQQVGDAWVMTNKEVTKYEKTMQDLTSEDKAKKWAEAQKDGVTAVAEKTRELSDNVTEANKQLAEMIGLLKEAGDVSRQLQLGGTVDA